MDESGSGKTVSIRALLRLLPDTAQGFGEAHFQGKELLGLPESELRRVRGPGIGMVFQNAMDALIPTRTLKVQLTEHLRWHGICSRADALGRAVDALDRVGIPEPHRRIRMYPFQLSGGMRQRAMIAMSIVAGPRLLIADEPTTAVDVTIQVLDVLKQLRDDGLAIVMITHDLGVARYFCDDVVVMKDGRGQMLSSPGCTLSGVSSYIRTTTASSSKTPQLTLRRCWLRQRRLGGLMYLGLNLAPFDVGKELEAAISDGAAPPELLEMLDGQRHPEVQHAVDLINQALAEEDPEAQEALVVEAAIAHEETYTSIPVLWGGYNLLVKPEVQNLKPWVFQSVFTTKGVYLEE